LVLIDQAGQTAADIAAMVAFLLSDDGSWVSGQIISVDGGTEFGR
jgi:NAD(P)-dependent dehydrogenase (short-subunit alcohol dehydrogenase family)